MKPIVPIRAGLLIAGLWVAASAPAQTPPAHTPPAQTVPATAPTAATPQSPAAKTPEEIYEELKRRHQLLHPAPPAAATPPQSPAPPAAVTPPQSPAPPIAAMPPQHPAQQTAKRAQVDFTSSQLTVTADNSSLNQILREISRLTGMKITGGVTDERVYGTYGPADTSTILSALLKGTGSNMLLIFDERQAPQVLVLSPRAGGPTPPSPSASRERDEDDLPPQRMPHVPRGDGFASAPPTPTPPPQPPVLPQPVPQTPEDAPAAAPAADTTTQQSPNGVPTPQQIYEQLMKNQQLQKTPATTPPQ